MRRLLLLLLVALVVPALAGVPAIAPPAGADPAPALTVHGEGPLPILLRNDVDKHAPPVDVFVVHATTDVADVHWSAAGTDDLIVRNPTGDLGDLAAGDTRTVELHLLAHGAGLRSLTFTLTADGQAAVSATDPYLFTPGAQVVDDAGSLAGHAYAYNGVEHRARCGCDTGTSFYVWFVDDRYAAMYDVPGQGPPHCPRDCLRYVYDPSTHLAEIAGDVLVDVQPGEGYVVNLGADDGKGGAEFAGLVPPHAGPHGTWLHDGPPFALSYERLHLGTDHHFDLRYAVSGIHHVQLRRHLHGTFRADGRGTLVLRYRGGRRVHHRTQTKRVTLLVRDGAGGSPQPDRLGIWLALSYQQGGDTHSDGNLMAPLGGR